MPKQQLKEKKSEITKFQKFEIETILRSKIKNAPYNPRIIDDYARKKLKDCIKKTGLVETLVWNKRSGNLVSGHQRISILDDLEKEKDYLLTVSVIDVDDKTEKEINVFLNNASAMGNYDLDLLADLAKDIDFTKAGFDENEIEMMFGDKLDLPSFHKEENEKVKHDVKTINKIKQETKDREKEFKAQQAELNSSEHYLVIVFKTDAEVDAFLKKLKLPLSEKYISSMKFECLLEGKHQTA